MSLGHSAARTRQRLDVTPRSTLASCVDARLRPHQRVVRRTGELNIVAQPQLFSRKSGAFCTGTQEGQPLVGQAAQFSGSGVDAALFALTHADSRLELEWLGRAMV